MNRRPGTGVEIAVVVCAHDERRWETLLATLASLRQQDHDPAETILVVDHNRSLLARCRRELAGVTVVDNNERRGLGGARNSGVAAASSDVVAFVDDDAVASPQWLARLAEHYRDDAVAGAGGAIEPVWPRERPPWFPPEFDWVVGCTYRGMPEDVCEVRNLIGCNMSYRRELLDELGRFQLGYGCDETDLCIRLRQRWPAKRLLYVPEARVFHQVEADRGRVRYFVKRCYFEGGSKAVVAKLVGAGDGLASERSYVRSTLPRGIVRRIHRFARRRDLDELAQAGMIFVGLMSTVAGYGTAQLRLRRAAERRGWNGSARLGYDGRSRGDGRDSARGRIRPRRRIRGWDPKRNSS